MNTYTIKITSDRPPQIMLGQKLLGCEVVAISRNDESEFITVDELSKKLPISKSTIINRLSCINKGTKGKHLYPRKQALAMLEAPPKKGRPRKGD